MNHRKRTKAGIKRSRTEGAVWGLNGKLLAEKNRADAVAFAESLRPVIFELMVNGCRNPNRLATELNRRGIPSAKGGRWHRQTAARLLHRIQSEFFKAMEETGRSKFLDMDRAVKKQAGGG